MTGTLPTFIDVADNFGGTLIPEDSLVRQWHNSNHTIVLLGDDIWVSLFDTMLDVKHGESSFNVKDLHSCDNIVLKYLSPTMKCTSLCSSLIDIYTLFVLLN